MENYNTSYGQDYMTKDAQYDPQSIQQNKQNLEKVSVYMNHPTAKIPKRQRFSNQMKSIFNHNMEWEQGAENSMRKIVPRARKTNLNLGHIDSKPEEFYKTSNQRYYSSKKNPSGRNGAMVGNFKEKNSKDHLVFGNYQNKYKTETGSNYLNYDIASTMEGDRGRPIPKKRSFNPLSFDQKNNFRSTYGANYTEKENPDSLNAFVNNFTERQKQYASNIMVQNGKTDYVSSYNATFNSNLGKTHPQKAINQPLPTQTRGKDFRNIIAFEESAPQMLSSKNHENKLRKNTPFGTSYNQDFKQYEMKPRKKYFPDLQRTNFMLGDYSSNYMTNNKENFQGQINRGNVMVAGKPSKTKDDNQQNIISGLGYTGQTNYDVFINKGKDKLKYI